MLYYYTTLIHMWYMWCDTTTYTSIYYNDTILQCIPMIFQKYRIFQQVVHHGSSSWKKPWIQQAWKQRLPWPAWGPGIAMFGRGKWWSTTRHCRFSEFLFKTNLWNHRMLRNKMYMWLFQIRFIYSLINEILNKWDLIQNQLVPCFQEPSLSSWCSNWNSFVIMASFYRGFHQPR